MFILNHQVQRNHKKAHGSLEKTLMQNYDSINFMNLLKI